MSLPHATLVLACILALGAVGPALAQPCVQDVDCDNGDTCSLPDLCILDTCLLGGLGDLDDDLVCDAELDTTFTFELSKVVLRRRTTGQVDNSSLKGRGDLLRSTGVGPLIGADGLRIRIKDALSAIPPGGDGADFTFTWLPADCATKLNGLTKCRSGLSSASFKPSPTSPNQFQFSFKIKGVANLSGPFFGPIRVVLTRGSLHRPDDISDCRLSRTGLQCRVF